MFQIPRTFLSSYLKSDFQGIFLSLPLKKIVFARWTTGMGTATRAETAGAEVRAKLNPPRLSLPAPCQRPVWLSNGLKPAHPDRISALIGDQGNQSVIENVFDGFLGQQDLRAWF